MEPAVSLLAGMPVCYIYRQQEGLTERTLAWATSRRLTDEVRSSLHSRSASTTRSFRLANTKAGTQRTGSQGNVYESIKDAAERTKISPNGIGSAASGMAGGYHWEYADD